MPLHRPDMACTLFGKKRESTNERMETTTYV